MVKVSFKEPDQYGQAHPEENEELIGEKLKAFDSAVEAIPTIDKENLILAQTNCPNQLNEDFKLQFLRCEVFDEKLAAKRYLKYWDKRVEIFGMEKAFQPLTLAGACSEDKAAFDFGVIRLVVGAKDPLGRSIVFFDPSRQDKTKYTTESLVRVFWYILSAALEDIDSQQKGVIVMGYPHNAKLAQFNGELSKHVSALFRGCLPVRVSAFHMCHPPSFFRVIFPIIKLLMGGRLRKRIRIHAGTESAVLKDLEKFGLTKDVIPSDLGGGIVLDHQKWLEERRVAGK